MNVVEITRNLLNKPAGTDQQLEAVAVAKDTVDNFGKVGLIIAGPLLIFAPVGSVGVTIIAGGVIGLWAIRDGVLGVREKAVMGQSPRS